MSASMAVPDHVRRTIGDVLGEQARRHGGKTFMTFVPTGARVSYRAMDDQARVIAANLLRLGVSKGDRVVLFLENAPEMVSLFFALALAGAVAVPINVAAKGRLLEHQLDLADPAAIIAAASLLDGIEAVATARGIRRLIVVGQQPEGAPTRHLSYDDLAAPAPGDPEALPAVHYSDLAMLLFTSGTTGPSKAVMVTQAQAVFWGGDVARHHEYQPDDVEYVFLPLFHGNALLNCTFGSLLAGSAIALAPRFSVSRFWDEVRRHRVTRLVLIGAVVDFLWKRPPGPADRDHQVRVVVLAPAPKDAAGFLARFGVKAIGGFGLTDFALASVLPSAAPPGKIASVGLPRSGITIRIVDEHDAEVAPGGVGEIVLRSDNPWGFSPGYFRNPQATLDANRNQWFHTGDCGYLDTDGYLYFTGRKKDAIRRRGENISAFEVEEVIGAHPAVLQAAVYAVRAEHAEDEVAASVVLRPGAELALPALVAHCRDNMAYFMVPRFLELVAELPRTPSQKVEKFKLRERASRSLAHLWDREAAGLVVGRG